MVYKLCGGCSTLLAATVEFFHRNRAKSDGLQTQCKACNKQYKLTPKGRDRNRAFALQAYHRSVQTPEGVLKMRERSLIDNHRKRAKIYGLPSLWSMELWRECLGHWHHQCVYCGSSYRLEHDHFIPLTDLHCPGNVPWNIVPACHTCNKMKGDSHPRDWIQTPYLFASLTVKLCLLRLSMNRKNR